jgi:hypothetical protein
MKRHLSVDIVRVSQSTRASWARRPEKESQMSDLDPRYLGNEREISARYHAGSFLRIPLVPHQMQECLTPTQDLIVLCHLLVLGGGIGGLAAATYLRLKLLPAIMRLAIPVTSRQL